MGSIDAAVDHIAWDGLQKFAGIFANLRFSRLMGVVEKQIHVRLHRKPETRFNTLMSAFADIHVLELLKVKIQLILHVHGISRK